MPSRLKFSHKILLAASLVVIATFALFTLFNDYLQRNAIHAKLESYLGEMGDITAHNIQNWLSGRILLLESTAQTIARDSAGSAVAALVKQPALSSTFTSPTWDEAMGSSSFIHGLNCPPISIHGNVPGTRMPSAPEARP